MLERRGCLLNSLLFLVCLLLPITGHIILTIMVLFEDQSILAKVAWLLFIWLVPIIGPLCYLLFGQRRHHVYFGRASYSKAEEAREAKAYRRSRSGEERGRGERTTGVWGPRESRDYSQPYVYQP